MKKPTSVTLSKQDVMKQIHWRLAQSRTFWIKKARA